VPGAVPAAPPVPRLTRSAGRHRDSAARTADGFSVAGWQSCPAVCRAACPDSGSISLTDVVHGQVAYGPEWQGRNAAGSYNFVIDLGTRPITEINSNWPQVRAARGGAC